MAAAAAALLLPAASAESKGLASAKVCGASDCRETRNAGTLGALLHLGPRADPPGAAGWYRMELTYRVEDAVDRSSVAVVPAAERMRAEDGTWFELVPVQTRALRRLVSGLAPRPASQLGSVEPPRARVDEVVRPPVDAIAAGGSGWSWIAGGSALVLIVGAGAVLLLRRRTAAADRPGEGSTAPAEG
ncbi:MAG TPA: hypothetical protein VHG69_13640 [Thermoleophilaceae bacterium]|nr:hypothetical protein [Thermoleophilaceae bacterium]